VERRWKRPLALLILPGRIITNENDLMEADILLRPKNNSHIATLYKNGDAWSVVQA